ncbi:MAG: corrinoid protein [Gracilibacteraceae bacterium]|jgi:corrinoid protein of di/trimethylamine methyltransferase|nr:corrinoid protein [Gracilibacteraceae bacterium]
MTVLKEELYQKMSAAIVEMEEDLVAELSRQAVREGIDAFEAIDQGLTPGMERAGQLFEEEEYFVPELLMCADAMNAGIDILKPHIKADEAKVKRKAVIGVIEGDTHDIGKNLVKLMLETGGFDVIDVGRDIPAAEFVERAKSEGAELICVSTLMTTTMDAMAYVISILKEQGIRDRFKVIVGGGPISPGFAAKIGADGYSRNAAEAVRLAHKLFEGKDL